MKTITVFTPTFNRAHLLPRLYESLCRQSCQDFLWLVIDDGSSDGSDELVKKWQAENRIPIEYHFKENGGMHTGHNKAIELIQTELNFCIDSDDYMPENAIEIIIDFWGKNKNEKYAGILGLDIFQDGTLVSSRKFPDNVKSGKYYQLKRKHNILGDVKFVYRTDVLKKYPPYPEFPNEKLTPLGYKYRLIDQDYDMLFLNEVLCIVEYQEDGSSETIIKQYFKSPKGFRYSRLFTMQYSEGFKDKFIQAGHFVKESIICRDFNLFTNNKKPLLTISAIPLGVLMYFYFKSKI